VNIDGELAGAFPAARVARKSVIGQDALMRESETSFSINGR
jgi:hypothetical protein